MRKYFLIIVVMMSFSAYAFRITDNHLFMQKDSIQPNNSSVTEKVEPDQYPKMRDCQDADGTIEGFKKCLINYLSENVQNTENLDGRAYLVFKVNTGGKAEKVVIHSNHNALIEEGERLLKQMPLFIPAQKSGKSIDFVYSIPLTFKRLETLKDEVYFTNPDVQARWENCENIDDTNRYLNKCIQSFMSEKITLRDDQRKLIYMLLKIDSDGNSMIEDIDGEDETLMREVVKKSREFPKFIPAMKNGKSVGSITLVSVVFNENEVHKLKFPEIFPQIQFCKTSADNLENFQKCLDRYAKNAFKYPELAVKYNIQRTVYVVFKIREDKSIEILAALGDETHILRNEAIRIIKNLPIKAPAMEKQKPTYLVFTYPITFKLTKVIDY
ncbi:energy transducer TonB [Capnocytophaga cynodegmi]|uniref:energy transducer TonB n=1 Tax=Capnocytophaga cynodegmi TaxID=28189 RepID=UPI00036E9411|nr:energy transducer TonB [Capnocytophaga cynodegmi]